MYHSIKIIKFLGSEVKSYIKIHVYLLKLIINKKKFTFINYHNKKLINLKKIKFR